MSRTEQDFLVPPIPIIGLSDPKKYENNQKKIIGLNELERQRGQSINPRET